MNGVVAYRAVLLAGALVAAWLLFWQITALLLAVVLTVIVAVPLTAATDRLHAGGVPRALAASGTMVLVIALFGGLGFLVGPTLVEQVRTFVDELPELINRAARVLGFSTGSGAGFELQALLVDYFSEPSRLPGRVSSVLTTVLAVAAGVLLVIFAATYAAIRPQPLVDGAVRRFSRHAARTPGS